MDEVSRKVKKQVDDLRDELTTLSGKKCSKIGLDIEVPLM
jgi:hypothetical protein